MNAAEMLYPSDHEDASHEIPGLRTENICFSVSGRPLLDQISLNADAGKVTVLTGPNGAGKSTTLAMLAGDICPTRGTVHFDDTPLMKWPSQALARVRAVLPQSPELGFGFRVRDVVAFGRHPHRGCVSHAEQQRAVDWAMEITAVTGFADRDCRHLSGGERHRVHFARALAQIWQPHPDGRLRALLLDEPTAGLDLFHQHSILRIARAMAAEGVAVIAVLHDLDQAAHYGDHLVVLDHGRVVASGAPDRVLTSALINDVWRIDCEFLQDGSGRRHIAICP